MQELAEARETIKRLNRRSQIAEAGVRDNVEECKAAGVSMGRTLANAAADMYLRRAEQAEAERDAQAELVGKLTAERDDIAADLDEARAQVWGLICAGTNIDEIRRRTFEALAQNVNSGRDLIKVMIFYQRERDEARAQLRELESPRDLLTAENARLQQEVATLELLRRGGK